jgi:hypothetical protein
MTKDTEKDADIELLKINVRIEKKINKEIKNGKFKGNKEHYKVLLYCIETQNIEGWNTLNKMNQPVKLQGADLSKANLSNADLSFANLSKANLSNTDLSNAKLEIANLSSAKLENALLRDSYFLKQIFRMIRITKNPTITKCFAIPANN